MASATIFSITPLEKVRESSESSSSSSPDARSMSVPAVAASSSRSAASGTAPSADSTTFWTSALLESVMGTSLSLGHSARTVVSYSTRRSS